MNLRHASAGLVMLATFAAFATLGTACDRPKRNNDWRSPSTQRPARCASDADCARVNGGTCTMELGASSGTCAHPGGALPPLPGADGGTGPGQAPPPNVQPSPSDIQI
ncbi:MAG: hypothetical protein JWP87_4362 [Labilithrix sp.]|jgi:hypothetical protein|nr:hypothetical protein [Labilithrix sp.]